MSVARNGENKKRCQISNSSTTGGRSRQRRLWCEHNRLAKHDGRSFLVRNIFTMMNDDETPSPTINFRAPPRRVDHTYRDYSQFPLDRLPTKSKKGSTNFPAKLHRILSNPDEYSHVRVQYRGSVFSLLNCFCFYYASILCPVLLIASDMLLPIEFSDNFLRS